MKPVERIGKSKERCSLHKPSSVAAEKRTGSVWVCVSSFRQDQIERTGDPGGGGGVLMAVSALHIAGSSESEGP